MYRSGCSLVVRIPRCGRGDLGSNPSSHRAESEIFCCFFRQTYQLERTFFFFVFGGDFRSFWVGAGVLVWRRPGSGGRGPFIVLPVCVLSPLDPFPLV